MTWRRVLLAAAISASVLGTSVSIAQAQGTNAERALALVGLARLKRDTGDVPAARRYFEEAARIRALTPTERTEYFWILQNVDADAALTIGRTVLRGTPADHDVRDRMIGLAIDLRREDVVVALAEEGARVQPATARWPRRVAESYARQRRPEQARAALGRVVEKADATDADRALHAAALKLARRSNVPAAAKAVPTAPPVEKPSLTREIELAVAESSFRPALDLIELLPPSDRSQPDMVALEGQLQLWSGNAQAAVPLLESALHSNPNNQAAREALVDALRVLQRPEDAWIVAAPLRAATSLTPARLVILGELAVDVENVERRRVLETLAQIQTRLAARPLEDTTTSPRLLDAVTIGVARARILTIDGRWAEALSTLDKTLELDSSCAPALKLRAELLSWSGEHALAIQTYDTYLAAQPDDLDARRQQARVAGWAGRTDLALALYDALAARFPNSQVVSAERAAKSAFLTGRWQAAADEYARWIALEPENGEARFEHAQSLRAAGHVAEADSALQALVQTSLHSMAFDAWSRVQLSRKPGVGLLIDTRAAAGYGGQRLLERQTEEGAYLATLGATGATRFDFSAGRATLRGADAVRQGYHGLARVSSTLSPTVELAARADVWDVWSDARPALEMAMQLRKRTADRWTIAAGFDRSLMFENLEVVDGRLAATGATGVLRFESTSVSFEAGTGWHHLSDGNARWRSFASYSRTINERWRGLRAIVWTELLSFREPALLYYSPESQIRIDAGAQYTHDFRVARFRGDRVNAVTGAYLIGTDRDGVIYHHPTVRASLEFARGLSFEARADWIRSSVYNDRTITFGISIGGSGGVRR